MTRVVVTGIGVYSSLGCDVESFWNACLEGRSVVEPIPAAWRDYADYRSAIWSPLPAPRDRVEGASRVEIAQNDPVALIASHAAAGALADADVALRERNRRANTLEAPSIDPHRAGVFMGTGIGGASSFLDNHAYQAVARTRQRLEEITADIDDPRHREALAGVAQRLRHGTRFNPFVVSMLMPNAVSAFLGIKFSFNGPNRTHAVACASGTVAIGQAFRAIRSGEIDFALAGGAEYLDDGYGGIFQGFDIARTLVRGELDPDRANRPFDSERSGFLFSQGGAAVLVLESERHARERNARPMARVSGYGETFDAHSMMSIAPDGAQIERMVGMALADASLGPDAVDYLNAHGTGTEANDPIEAAIVERLFGDRVRVNSTKSLLGHTLGASGAFEAAVTALSLRDQATHACRNLDRPIAPLGFVREPGRLPMRAALSQSFAFGGHNAALVFERAEGG